MRAWNLARVALLLLAALGAAESLRRTTETVGDEVEGSSTVVLESAVSIASPERIAIPHREPPPPEPAEPEPRAAEIVWHVPRRNAVEQKVVGVAPADKRPGHVAGGHGPGHAAEHHCVGHRVIARRQVRD